MEVVKSLALLFYHWILPLVLLSAGIFRCTLLSFFYLLGFVVVTLTPLSVYKPSSKTIGIVIVSLIALFSSLILIAMCIFSILALLAGYGYFILPESDFGRDLIGTIIGFHWGPTVTVVQYIQMTVPDPVVFAVSLVTVCLIGKAPWVTPALIKMKKRMVKNKEKQDQHQQNLLGSLRSYRSLMSFASFRQQKQKNQAIIAVNVKDLQWNQVLARYIHGYLQLLLVLLAGSMYSSILTSVYLISGMCVIVLIAFGYSIFWLEWLTWRLILVMTVGNLFYMYLNQFEYGDYSIAPIYFSGTNGPVSWINSTYSLSDMWYIFAEFLILILIIFLLGFRINAVTNYEAKMKILNKKAEVVSLSKVYRKKKPTQEENEKKASHEPEDFKDIAYFFDSYGFQIAFLGYLFSCVLTPSLIQAIPLIIVMYGSTLLKKRYLRFFMPPLLLYSTSFLFAQAIYNIQFDFPSNDYFKNFGLIRYDPYLLYIGVQAIAISLLAVYWRYSAYFRRHKKSKSAAGEKKETDKILENDGKSYNSVKEDEQAQSSQLRRSNSQVGNATDSESESDMELDNPDIRQQILERIQDNSSLNQMPLEEREKFQARQLETFGKKGKRDKFMEIVIDVVTTIKTALHITWQMFLQNSYLITLFGLLLCSLLSVTIFNFIYLIFFVVFLLSMKIAFIFWGVLVLYTESVILVIYVWQVTWTEDFDDTTAASLFGLQHYDFLLKGLAIPLFILIFSMLQLQIIRLVKMRLKQQGKSLRKSNISEIEENDDLDKVSYPRFLLILINTITMIRDNYSLVFCYFFFFFVAILGSYDLFSLSYLLVVYACLLIHEIFEEGKSKIRAFWGFIVIITGIILISIYFFQFEAISDELLSLWPEKINKYLTLADIGLNYETTKQNLYIALLGTSIIFFLSVLQLREFLIRRPGRDGVAEDKKGYEAIPDKKKDDVMYVTDFYVCKLFIAFLKRFFILHAGKISLFLAFIAVIYQVSFLGDLLLLLIIISMILSNQLDTFGLFLMLYLQFITVIIYVLEFDGITTAIQKYIFEDNYSMMISSLQWIGVPANADLFKVTIMYNVLIFFLVLERLSVRWSLEPEFKQLKTVYGDKCPLFLVSRNRLDKNISLLHPELDRLHRLFSTINLFFLARRIMWWLSNVFRKHGIHIFVIVLLLTAFFRYNVWSVFEILLVAVGLVYPSLLLKTSPILLFVFSFIVYFEYSTYLGVPPTFESPPWDNFTEDVQAWFTVGDGYNIYTTIWDFLTLLLLCLLFRGTYVKKHSTADVLDRDEFYIDEKVQDVFFEAVEHHQKKAEASESLSSDSSFSSTDLLPIPSPIDSHSKAERDLDMIDGSDNQDSVQPTNLVVEGISDIEQMTEKVIASALNQQIVELNDKIESPAEQIFEIHSWRDRVIYITCRYSLHFIMFFMFLTATVQANLFNFGYVCFSLFFLYKDALMTKRKNQLWKWGRIYNYLVMLCLILFQFPFIPACLPSCENGLTPGGRNCTMVAHSDINSFGSDCQPYAIQSIIGLYKFGDSRDLFSSTILFDVIIFILMAIQAAIFDTTTFSRVANHLTKEREQAVYRAKIKYLQFLRREQRAIAKIALSKQKRKERLEFIRTYRREKQYLAIQEQKEEVLDLDDQYQSQIDQLILQSEGKKDEEEEEIVASTTVPINPRVAELKGNQPKLNSGSMQSISSQVSQKSKKELEEEEELEVEQQFKEDLSYSPETIEKQIEDILESFQLKREEDEFSDDEEKALQLTDGAELTEEERKKKEEDEDKDWKDQIVSYLKIGKDYLLKFYNKFYKQIIKYLYRETFIQPDETKKTKLQIYWLGFYYYTLNQSHVLVYLAFLLNNIVYANLLSLIYTFLLFAYAIMENPIPPRNFWRACIVYTYFVIIVKFLFQISVFCVCYSPTSWYYWFLEPYCSASTYCNVEFEESSVILENLPELFGITKMTIYFSVAIGLDLLVLFTLLLHRNITKKAGLWLYLSDREELMFQFFLIHEHKLEERNKAKKARKKRKEKAKKERKLLSKQEIKKTEGITKSEKRIKKLKIKLTKIHRQYSQQQVKTAHMEAMKNKKVKAVEIEILQLETKIPRLRAEIQEIQQKKQQIRDQEALEDLLEKQNAEKIEQEEEQEIDKLYTVNHHEVTERALPEGIIDEEEEEEEDEEYDPNQKEGDPISKEVEIQLNQTEEEKLGKTKLIKYRIKHYFYRLLEHKATARDYYVPMVTVEVLGFFFMILCQNSFTYNPPEGYSFVLLESRIPKSFFLILLAQFLFIVFDRVIYLFRSIFFKIILQYVTLTYYTVLLFLILPEGRSEWFDDQWVIWIYYISKMIYWWLSGLQIAEGYPVDIQKRWMTKSYGQIRYYLFQVYLMIPFLFELRSMLDWTIFDTTLNFFQWMTLEDIYRNLFLVKCKRENQKQSNWYEKQSFLTKNIVGAAAFIGLIVLLWLPLFLLSSANPTNQPNPVVSATFQISIEGFSPFYDNMQDKNITFVTDDQFSTIRSTFPAVLSDEESGTQVLVMKLFSDTIWVMTPPASANLQNTLIKNNTAVMKFTYIFTRTQPPGSEVLQGSNKVELSYAQKMQLAQMMGGNEQVSSIIVQDLIPRLYKLPLSGAISVPDTNNLDIVLSLNRTIYDKEVLTNSNSTPSSVEVLLPYWYIANSPYNQSLNYVDEADEYYPNPELVITNADIPSILSASLAASGIIGLYVTIVLAVGRFLRMGVSDLQYNIVFEYLPEPQDLVTMCEDIFMAREDGDLMLERDLWNEIIQLYRSPESIIAVTKLKEDPPPGWGTAL